MVVFSFSINAFAYSFLSEESNLAIERFKEKDGMKQIVSGKYGYYLHPSGEYYYPFYANHIVELPPIAYSFLSEESNVAIERFKKEHGMKQYGYYLQPYGKYYYPSYADHIVELPR